MTRLIFTISIFIAFFSCQNDNHTQNKPYELVMDGIYFEIVDSTNTNPNRYTIDNQLYKGDNSYIYNYYYENLDGEKFLSELKQGIEKWKLVPIDSANEKTFTKVKMTVNESNPVSFPSDYSQTVIDYEILNQTGESRGYSSTGLVENQQNIWMHPPRDLLFRILQLNPWPFIQKPYEVGNTFGWKLGIGDAWGDERWKNFEGSVENVYHYEITDKAYFSVLMGDLECFKIEATAESRIGKSGLTAYFNQEYGFVKLEYLNIDSSRLVMELVEMNIPKKE